jgi:hypothetical protein
MVREVVVELVPVVVRVVEVERKRVADDDTGQAMFPLPQESLGQVRRTRFYVMKGHQFYQTLK